MAQGNRKIRIEPMADGTPEWQLELVPQRMLDITIVEADGWDSASLRLTEDQARELAGALSVRLNMRLLEAI